MKGFQYSQVHALATTACDPANKLQNEFLQLIQKADKIYNPVKRKKPRNQ
jgi:Ca-activated chloride channel family protein